jgi:hypothetical protein
MDAPSYGVVPQWQLRLAGCPSNVTKMWASVQLNLACGSLADLGNRNVGHFVTGLPVLSYIGLVYLQLHVRFEVCVFV